MATFPLDLRFEGANGATTTVDSSYSPLTVTLENGATLSTDFSVVGSTSLKLIGSLSRATIPANSRFNFGSGDFKIQSTFRKTASGTVCLAMQSQNLATNNNRSWAVIVPDSGINFYYTTDGVTDNGFTAAATISINTTYELVIERIGSTLYTYLNGSLIDSRTFTVDIFKSTADLCIGTFGRYASPYDQSFTGFIDSFYVESTGSPNSLLTMTGANGSSTFTDTGTGGITWTNTGSPVVSDNQLSLNSTSYLEVANNANFDISGKTFSLSIKVKPTITSGVLIAKAEAILGWSWGLFYDASGIQFLASDGGSYSYLTCSQTIAANEIALITVDCNNGSLTVRKNGVGIGTKSYSSLANPASKIGIGVHPETPATLKFEGLIDDVSFTKGFITHSSDFTINVTGTASISDGADSVSAIGLVGKVTATASISDGANLISATGVLSNVLDISGDLPSLIGDVVAYNAGDVVSGDLPSLIGYAYAGDYINVELPSLTGSATAYTHALAYVDGALPMLVFNGQILSTEILYANSTLPMFTGYAYTGDTISGTLPSLLSSAVSDIGSTSIVKGTLPSLIGDVQSVSIATLRAAAMLPMLISGSDLAVTAVLPMLVGFGAVEGQEVALFEAYSINLKHNSPESVNEVSHYPDYAGFEQIVRFGNDYFARTPDGLFKIGGDTDNYKDINSSIQTGYEDLGTRNYKTIKSIYVGGKMDPGFNVSVFASEDADKPRVYDNQTSRDKLPRNNRVVPGAGIRSSYIGYGISNIYGGKLDIDRVELEVFISNQRSI